MFNNKKLEEAYIINKMCMFIVVFYIAAKAMVWELDLFFYIAIILFLFILHKGQKIAKKMRSRV